MIQLIKKFRQASLLTQGITSAFCIGLYFTSSYFLEQSYVLSKFPVPYFVQQTSFDAVKMKEWYSVMVEADTFGIYLNTQLIDFLFIATVILAGFTLWTFVASLHKRGSFFRRWGYILAISLPLAAAFDILENLVSFFMIADPESFNDLLVFPYSTFATIKFGCWGVGLAWLTLALIALPFTLLIRSKKIAIISLAILAVVSVGQA